MTIINRDSLTRGMLALTLLGWGLLQAPGQFTPTTLAEEIDCDDPDNFNDPDCVQRRREAGLGEPAAEAPPASTEQGPSDAPPPPDAVAKAGDPGSIIFTLDDAGKEATQFAREEGTDARGRWAHSRYERGRDLGASRQGPNVIDSRAWVAKDVDAAKALFKEQAAIKDFPERVRSEGVAGLNDKLKQFNVAEETFAIGGYWEDNTIWQHYRIVMRKGQNVAVLYLYGREDFLTEDAKDKDPNGKIVEWFARKLAGRL